VATDDQTLTTDRFILRHLPLATRLVIALFLISVGIGYSSALVQLNVQHAAAGQLLPGPDEVKDVYFQRSGKGELERLIRTDENRQFNGSGSMRSAFTFRSSGWKREIRQRADKMKKADDDKLDLRAAEKELRKERDLEIASVVAWIHAGAKKDDYEKFLLPDDIAKLLPAEPDGSFFAKDDTERWVAQVSSIIDTRCARCHAPGKGGSAGRIHLDEYQNVMDYVPPYGKPMPLEKLAQTTHVHLLGFSMLYGLTGLIFVFTSYPAPVRTFLAPLPLLAQVVEISFWWLTRFDPMFAYGIMSTGGIVAMGLGLQIVLSLWDMYGIKGKIVLVLLAVAGAALAGGVYGEIIAPYLEAQKTATVP
jgi:hypothetical protein